MHELSIAQSMIELACEAAAREGAVRVTKLVARIGVLSGVVKEALLFSFELAAEGTACEGAALVIEDVPLTVMCPSCGQPKTLAQLNLLSCPTCAAPTADILTGTEMELVSLEVDAHEASRS